VATPFVLLQQLLAARESGVLFVVMRDGHQLRLGLADGRIHHLSFAMRRGAAALALVRATSATTANFVRAMPAGVHPDLPAREALLDVLRPVLSQGAAVDVEPPEELAPSTKQPRISTANGSEGTRVAPMDELRDLLVEYVGPIGDLLLQQEAAAGRSWAELVESLAREVSPPSAAQTFRAAALRIGSRR
jgi:hypothetical protein